MDTKFNRYPTKEELERIKKNNEAFKIKMGWSKKEEKKLPELSETEFLEKLKTEL